MGTFSKSNLTIDNFMSPVYYKVGRGTAIVEKSKSNYYDNKLDFLNSGYSCTIYTLPVSNFLPNIAVKFYGTSSLWWVIARFNGIIFPLSEIQAGTKLFIPTLSDISKALNQAQNKSESFNTNKVVF